MRVLNNFDQVETWKPILISSLIVIRTVVDDELSQKVKLLGRPQTAFPAHFDIIYRACNDHDTSYMVTRLNDKKRPAILLTF